MPKRIILSILIIALPLYLFASDYRLMYSDYSVAYSTILSPSSLENNTTGTTDSPAFSAALGFNLYEWVNIYAGASFMFFPYFSNMQKHYSFIPVFGGIKLNLFPEFGLYPSVFAELGKAISNYHNVIMMTDVDKPWTADYLNWGFDLNYRLNDIAILVLRIDMPQITGTDGIEKTSLFRGGLGWKVNY